LQESNGRLFWVWLWEGRRMGSCSVIKEKCRWNPWWWKMVNMGKQGVSQNDHFELENLKDWEEPAEFEASPILAQG
jgi:hypothetical protein